MTVEAARLQHGPQLLRFGTSGGCQSGINGHAFENIEMEMHFGRSVLVVHPQSPNHFWQGIENGAIDGTEIFEGLGLTTLIQRQSPTSDFLKDGPQVLGGKDFGSFAQRSQRSGANAQKTLHFFQLGGTLQRPHAFDNRIEKIQQQQGGVLVEEQFAIPRFVARSPHRLESFVVWLRTGAPPRQANSVRHDCCSARMTAEKGTNSVAEEVLANGERVAEPLTDRAYNEDGCRCGFGGGTTS